MTDATLSPSSFLRETLNENEHLRKQVDALPVTDQAKFADGLKSVSDNLAKVSKSGEQALDTLRQGEVGQAMAKQPGCQDSGATPSKS